ncbi:hypothetical protein ACFV4E_37180 [Streptomyces hygroscopicus]|uniref:SMI1/KNR4 family protein n=1 Tax=Streptomyces demainii TaxID=588122 RepID=A0ABT9KR71_9ACTN|nr:MULTISPECIES: hypothetical protein [Streptomyces]MDP9610900.1 hypothetical protein [Streptomyces demainii]
MLNILSPAELPKGFTYPHIFIRAAESGLTSLEPWWLLEGDNLRARHTGLQQRFPNRALVPFARREDNDDVACWDLNEGNVCIVHDFSSPGSEQRGSFESFADWLRAALEDFIEFE